MHASDARILRGAAIPTGLAGAAAAAVCLALAGGKGALGAAIGAFVVIAFFSISVIAVSYASKVSPQMMFAAAVFSYITKVLVMFALVAALDGVTVWDSRAFGWSVIALALVWIGAEIRHTTRAKTLYVDPAPASGEPSADSVPGPAGAASQAGPAADRGP